MLRIKKKLNNMAKVKLYNKEAKEAGELELDDAVFGVRKKDEVIYQIYNAMMANAREPWAHSKNKGEVSGGGKKPWKQKGTGRARHGSNRSPLWVGGGVTFGPLKTRNYKQKIQKKMSQLAVRMCLSAKVKEEKFIVLEDLKSNGKTKEMAEFRKALPGLGKTTLLLMDSVDDKINLATRNVPKLDMQQAKDVNVVDLMHHQYIIITKKGVQKLEKRLAK